MYVGVDISNQFHSFSSSNSNISSIGTSNLFLHFGQMYLTVFYLIEIQNFQT